jgi:hypothetical protein
MEASDHKRQLDTARNEIDHLRAEIETLAAELEAKPEAAPSIPNTAIGRFLHAWSADLRNAA